MARKGVLLSDPSVEAMSFDQWRFEFEALREKERADSDLIGELCRFSVRSFRNALIQLLGLNIGAGDPAEGDTSLPYIPMVMTLARPEVAKHLAHLENAEAEFKSQEADAMVAANEDLTAADLEVVFTPDPAKIPGTPEHMQMLRDMGVKLVDGRPAGE